MATIAGKRIGEIGFGLMSFTWRPIQTADDQAFETMKTALNAGANFWNGGEMYGPPDSNSLHLLNRYFAKYPNDAEKVVISIKGGLVQPSFKPDGTPEHLRQCVERSIEQLGNKKNIDMYQMARVDVNTPIETSIGALGELVKEGKIDAISLSEVSADSIKRAAKVHKISAVEVEFSLFATECLSNGVAEACVENNIPIVAYSPLGRGILTGQIKSPKDIPEGDIRHHLPRFQPEHFDKNLDLVREVEQIAKRKGCTPGQVALGWVVSRSGSPGMPTIIPIPGTVSSDRVKENLAPAKLNKEEVDELDELVRKLPASGGRYGDMASHLEYGDTPPLK